MMNYSIYKTESKAISQIDWSRVPAIKLVDNADGSEAEYRTSAMMTYNNDGIFFRFGAQDDTINCTMTGYNQPIYDEETVEFFLATTSDKRRYLELEWNGIGGVFCAMVDNDLNGNTKLTYQPKNVIISKIIECDGGWAIEGFIPKSLFEGDMSGSWLFNAYRIKRRKDNSMYLMAYSPTKMESFHQPDFFVELKFI